MSYSFDYIFLALISSALFLVASCLEETWDLDKPCQEHIQRFAAAQAGMVKCASNFSSPPKVCTNCIDEYIAFKEAEYVSHHLDNVTSLDNTTCSNVIYSNYLLSYSWDISNLLTKQIWDKSRCSSCLVISWDFENMNSTISYDDKTLEFQNVLFKWRDCVTNYSEVYGYTNNESSICVQCETVYNDLFAYYWKVYSAPDIDFCVDVESTMNDTMHLWHNVWSCPDDGHKDRKYDVRMLIVSVGVLALLLIVFYGGSYINAERMPQNLVRYSRLDPPQGQRSRLVSTSSFYSTPGSASGSAASGSTRSRR